MDQHDYLKRLDSSFYKGHAWVHWTQTMDYRKTGWLTPTFLYRFREILAHTCFRFDLACFIYCLMPDHLHMLWHGLTATSDQLRAIAFFRKASNESLRRIGFQWQNQAHDRVLREEEFETNELQNLGEYIARNPERSGLVPVDGYASYKYSGCLLPGYPELRLFERDSWTRVWRAMYYLKKTSVFVEKDEVS
ncbi:MAG: transposase [Pirellulales bacterium]